MQERAISSHEQYDLLSEQVKNNELIEGFGQLMRELAKAIAQQVESMISGEAYRHLLSLRWTVTAMHRMLEDEKEESHYLTLSLLMRNLTGLEKSLREELGTVSQIDPSAYSRKPERKGGPRELFTPTHPLSVCRTAHPRAAGPWDDAAAPLRERSLDPTTSLIVFQQTYSATRMRLFHRVLGTLLGAGLGDLKYATPTQAGHILLLLASSMPSSTGSRRTTPSLPSSSQPSYWRYELRFPVSGGDAARIIDTLIGGMIAYLVVRFRWPDWQYKQLPTLLHTAVVKNK